MVTYACNVTEVKNLNSGLSIFFRAVFSMVQNSHRPTATFVPPLPCIISTVFPYLLLQMCDQLFQVEVFLSDVSEFDVV